MVAPLAGRTTRPPPMAHWRAECLSQLSPSLSPPRCCPRYRTQWRHYYQAPRNLPFLMTARSSAALPIKSSELCEGRRSAWPAWGRWRIGLVKPCPSWRLRSRQGATPEALRQASVRRSSGRSTSVPPSRGYASSQSHALVAGTFRVSAREPEREIVRWGPGRAWRGFPSRQQEHSGIGQSRTRAPPAAWSPMRWRRPGDLGSSPPRENACSASPALPRALHGEA
jgi:hypothetical protein